MSASLRIVPLSSSHDRTTFISGSEPLDRYFREQAAQDVKRRISTCFVAVDTQTETIAGFYTLAATSIALDALASETSKKLPRYPIVPATLLGRLAVSIGHQGQGIGSILLGDALIRASRAEMGVFMMLVHAKNEAAERFYDRYGFQRLIGQNSHLCLPIATALNLIEKRAQRT